MSTAKYFEFMILTSHPEGGWELPTQRNPDDNKWLHDQIESEIYISTKGSKPSELLMHQPMPPVLPTTPTQHDVRVHKALAVKTDHGGSLDLA
jgi:hypothetical protein